MRNLAFILLLLPLFAWTQVTSKLVPINHVYVPDGFDDNDNAEIIISGYLPDSCYKAPKHEYKIQGNVISITVSSLYNSDSGACAEVIVPFIETVRLGALVAKSYDVVVTSGNPQRIVSKMMVKKSGGAGIDDYSYAYITGIRHSPGNRKIVIDGYNVSDCFELQELKIESNGNDTYVVLPIMKQTQEFCPRKMTPVSFEAVLPTTLRNKEILIHVRSMHGNSVNAIYYAQVLK